MGHHTSYSDAYVVPATNLRHRRHITNSRGYSGSVLYTQPTATGTYTVTGDPQIRPRLRDQSHSRRSRLDSNIRPMIITTSRDDRLRHNSAYGTTARSSNQVHDGYRYGGPQHYTLATSWRRTRSSAGPQQESGNLHHGDRVDCRPGSCDVSFYRQAHHSVSYANNFRRNTVTVDYDKGYKYTNAGELARDDLKNSGPSRSKWNNHCNRDYIRSRPVLSTSYRSEPQYYLDRGHVMTHGRTGRKLSQPFTRVFDKTDHDCDFLQGSQFLLPSLNPPKQSHVEVTGSLRDSCVAGQNHASFTDQEPTYHDSFLCDFHRNRHNCRGRKDGQGCSANRGPKKWRPNSTQFVGDSVSSRGIGVHACSGVALDSRRQRTDQGQSDHMPLAEDYSSLFRMALRDLPLSLAGSKYAASRGEGADDDISSNFSGDASTELGRSVAAAAASRLGSQPPKRLEETDLANTTVAADDSPHVGLEPFGALSEDDRAPHVDDRQISRQKLSEQLPDDCIDVSNDESTMAPRDNLQSAPTLGVVGKGKMGLRGRLRHSFDPNDRMDMSQIREQLAALEVRGEGTPSCTGEEKASESFLVGSPIGSRQGRVVSFPRANRDAKPLRGILKQPSTSFPEEDDPVREGVALHKNDKKLREFPLGARWTKIRRKLVNPEALAINNERFEERGDFIIVLRVLSRDEVQEYAAETQFLRERRGKTRVSGHGNEEKRILNGAGISRQLRHRYSFNDDGCGACGSAEEGDSMDSDSDGRLTVV